MFLYAYSPLIDLSGEHCGAFLLDHVRHSFKVREEMPWGKEIPEIIFRHFVFRSGEAMKAWILPGWFFIKNCGTGY